MIGTLINATAIVIGSGIGTRFRKFLRPEQLAMIEGAMGLVVLSLAIGMLIDNLPKSESPVLSVIALPLGTLIGTLLNLDQKIGKLFARFCSSSVSEGITTGVLLFCVGTLSILGPIQSALYGDQSFLIVNSILTMVTSIVLASSYGMAISFCAMVLFIWQGIIYVLALFLGSFITQTMMVEISIVGALLVMSSSLSILKIRDLKTLNMIPALVIPVIYLLIAG